MQWLIHYTRAHRMWCTRIWHSEYWKIIWKGASHSRRFPVCLQSVEITIYRRMERCGLRALNFSNISDDEFWTWRKRLKIFLFVENKCWIFFTKKEASKECHENSDFWPQTLKTQTPKLQTLCNVFMLPQCSKETAKKEQNNLISPPVYHCRIDQTVKN